MKTAALILGVFVVFPVSAGGLTKIGEVTHPAVAELSGIVASSFPNVFWIHNDSGDTARIFAIREDGSTVLPRAYSGASLEDWPGFLVDNAFNHDWEDIALAEGTLYLADVGNNENSRRDLGIYLVHEPNPHYVTRTRAIEFLPIRYPDQENYPASEWHFDCEALFSFGGKLYLLTKHRRAGRALEFDPGTKLYRLDSMHRDRENVLRLIDRNDDVTLVTAADMSPDEQRLAVLTYSRLWVFERPVRGDRWLNSRARVMDLQWDTTKQVEAIAWESGDSLLMTNEDQEMFRVSTADLIKPSESTESPQKALQPWRD